ncbi:hypothetical protein CLV32_0039 [Pedobacter duraquae]|uniref:Uncharacterized protein n=1 Tax=Pedobacter duraquae TaxID=425511 RepID=A0A4R6IND1_9SPHI|nr:hypothetical protein CLV32_0039 [Pedobacter duraquae]
MDFSQNIPERCETLWVFLCHVLAVFVKQTLKNCQKGGKNDMFKFIDNRLHKLIFRRSRRLPNGTMIYAKGRPFPIWVPVV